MKKALSLILVLVILSIVSAFELYDRNSVLSLYAGWEEFAGFDPLTGDIMTFSGVELQGKLLGLRFGLAADLNDFSIKSYRISWEQNFNLFSAFVSYNYVEWLENRLTTGMILPLKNLYLGAGAGFSMPDFDFNSVFVIGRYEIGAIGLDGMLHWNINSSPLYGFALDYHLGNLAFRATWYSNSNWYVNVGFTKDPEVSYSISTKKVFFIDQEVQLDLEKKGLWFLEPSGDNTISVYLIRDDGKQIELGTLKVSEKKSSLFKNVQDVGKYRVVLKPNARFNVNFNPVEIEIHSIPKVNLEVPSEIQRTDDTKLKLEVLGEPGEVFEVGVRCNEEIIFNRKIVSGTYEVPFDTSKVGKKVFKVFVYGRYFGSKSTVVKAKYKVEFKKPKHPDLRNIIQDPVKVILKEEVKENGSWKLKPVPNVKYDYLVTMYDIIDKKKRTEIKRSGFTDSKGEAVLDFEPKVSIANIKVRFDLEEPFALEPGGGLRKGRYPGEVVTTEFPISDTPYKLVYQILSKNAFIGEGNEIYIKEWKEKELIYLKVGVVNERGSLIKTEDDLKVKALIYDGKSLKKANAVKTPYELALDPNDFTQMSISLEYPTPYPIYLEFYLEDKGGRIYFADVLSLRYVGKLDFDEDYTLKMSKLVYGEPSRLSVRLLMGGFYPVSGALITAFVETEDGGYTLEGITDENGECSMIGPELETDVATVTVNAEFGGIEKERVFVFEVESDQLTFKAKVDVDIEDEDKENIKFSNNIITGKSNSLIRRAVLKFSNARILESRNIRLIDLKKIMEEINLIKGEKVERINSYVKFVAYDTSIKGEEKIVISDGEKYYIKSISKTILLPEDKNFLPIYLSDFLKGFDFEEAIPWQFEVRIKSTTIGEPDRVNPARYSLYLNYKGRELYLGSVYRGSPSEIALPNLDINFIVHNLKVFRKGVEIPGEFKYKERKLIFIVDQSKLENTGYFSFKISLKNMNENTPSVIFAQATNTLLGIPMHSQRLFGNVLTYGQGYYDFAIFVPYLRNVAKIENKLVAKDEVLDLRFKASRIDLSFEDILRDFDGYVKVYVDNWNVISKSFKGKEKVKMSFYVPEGMHSVFIDVQDILEPIRIINIFKKSQVYKFVVRKNVSENLSSVENDENMIFPKSREVIARAGEGEYVLKGVPLIKTLYISVPTKGLITIFDENLGLSKISDYAYTVSADRGFTTIHVDNNVYSFKFIGIYDTKKLIYHVPGYLPKLISLDFPGRFDHIVLKVEDLRINNLSEEDFKMFRVMFPKETGKLENYVKIYGEDGRGNLLPVIVRDTKALRDSLPDIFIRDKLFKDFSKFKDHMYYLVCISRDKEFSTTFGDYSHSFELLPRGVYYIQFTRSTKEAIELRLPDDLSKLRLIGNFYEIKSGM